MNLSEWELEAFHEFTGLVQKAASEAITLALNDDDTGVFWPAQYDSYESDGLRGDAVADPLTIYLSIALSADSDAPVVRGFSLRDALADTLQECAADGSWSEGLERIRDALRQFANDIDEAVTTADATQPTTTSKKKGRRR